MAHNAKIMKRLLNKGQWQDNVRNVGNKDDDKGVIVQLFARTSERFKVVSQTNKHL